MYKLTKMETQSNSSGSVQESSFPRLCNIARAGEKHRQKEASFLLLHLCECLQPPQSQQQLLKVRGHSSILA